MAHKPIIHFKDIDPRNKLSKKRRICPVGIYLFKVNNGNTRAIFEIWLKMNNKDTRTMPLTLSRLKSYFHFKKSDWLFQNTKRLN